MEVGIFLRDDQIICGGTSIARRERLTRPQRGCAEYLIGYISDVAFIDNVVTHS